MIFTIHFMWGLTIILGFVRHHDQLPYPLAITLIVLFFVLVVPSCLRRYSRNLYLFAEIILSGSLFIALNFFFEGVRWQFIPIAFLIGYHSVERSYRWTGPLAILAIPFLVGEAIGFDFQLIVVSDLIVYHFAAYALGFAFQLLSHMHKQGLIIQHQNQILEQYTSRVEEITLLEERNKMSRELHDTVGHTMTSLIMGMEMLRSKIPDAEASRLDMLLRMARQGLDESRGIFHKWAQNGYESATTMESAFVELIEQFQVATGVSVKLRMYGAEYALSRSIKLTLYRCLQETLTNAVRHGKASQVQVGLYFEEAQIRLQVEDNGQGNGTIEFGFGLQSMKERLEALQGRLSIHCMDEGGVTVICSLPAMQAVPSAGIRILIVDDQPFVRESLQLVLQNQQDLQVVGVAENGLMALDIIPKEKPDVVLLDVQMPVMDGAKTIQAIRERWPDMRVIMLTTFEETALAAETLGRGANGYLLKSVSPVELVEAIRVVHQGEALINHKIAEVLFKEMRLQQEELNGLRQKQGRDCPYGLTERERGILASLVEGLRMKTIAEKIFLSEGTVRNCTTVIYAKLGVKNREEAVKKARDEGLTG
ncbi:two-component hybrid sensor and regulator [Brevibacillus brevis NBRC 100599]|uniref:Two-component hybrid sensor and regulator n=2 Tax=Brevibacillus brevis TaxID=1393 RepID=C0Z9R4_BREBN|nr:two-component hybrid sensor and regulator [Brevibacillus brevis NBRC 100599]